MGHLAVCRSSYSLAHRTHIVYEGRDIQELELLEHDESGPHVARPLSMLKSQRVDGPTPTQIYTTKTPPNPICLYANPIIDPTISSYRAFVLHSSLLKSLYHHYDRSLR